MSVTTPDHKIALRDYLRGHAGVTAIATTERIVLDFQAVTAPGNWIVLSRSGGGVDLYTPMRLPRVDIVTYGANRWEAIRLMEAVSDVLGLDDRMKVPRIEGSGVIITDILPEADVTEGSDNLIPGIEAELPFAFRACHCILFEAA